MRSDPPAADNTARAARARLDSALAARAIPFRGTPCTPTSGVSARCGTITVPESYQGRGEPTPIRLRVVVLPPIDSPAARDPIIVLQGGPGQAATTLADFYGGESWAAARRTREIVLVDQRGTGGSNPLDCFLGGPDALSLGYVDALFPRTALRACGSELRQRADLARYGTLEAMLDLEVVRASLGAEQINLYGTSYGTRLALAYMGTYPDRVRSAVLKGVVPPDAALPRSFARDVQRSLELLGRDCAADTTCSRRMPNVVAAVDSVVRRLRAAPQRVLVATDTTSRRSPVTLSQGIVASTIRSLLQSPTSAVRIPGLVRAFLDGDPMPMARMVHDIQQAAATGIFEGMRMSVICAEDAPRLDSARAANEARGTALGTYWLDQVIGGCREWPVTAVPTGFLDPDSAGRRVPTLLISGEEDPATPPPGAESLHRRMPNSRHVVVKHASHSFALMRGCVDVLIADFYRAASAATLDASCAERVTAPPFPAFLTPSISTTR